jgi:hypothetical protein
MIVIVFSPTIKFTDVEVQQLNYKDIMRLSQEGSYRSLSIINSLMMLYTSLIESEQKPQRPLKTLTFSSQYFQPQEKEQKNCQASLLYDQINVSIFRSYRGVERTGAQIYFVAALPGCCINFWNLRFGHGGSSLRLSGNI